MFRIPIKPVFLSLLIALTGHVHAEGFFSPYSPDYIWAGQFEQPVLNSAFAKLDARVKLAENRIDRSHVYLASQAAFYEQAARDFEKRSMFNAAHFYADLSRTVGQLPEELGLTAALAHFKAESQSFLAEARAEFAADPDQSKSKATMLKKWHDIMKRYEIFNRYFSDERLSSQQQFEQQLIRTAVPLFAAPVGFGQAGRVTLDAQTLMRVIANVHNGYLFDFGFLAASLSPTWNQGDSSNHRLLLTRDRALNLVGVDPEFNALDDRETIGMVLEGSLKANVTRPLHVRLVHPLLPWWTGLSRTKPSYNAEAHELTAYLGAYKGHWGTTNWSPASDSPDCALLLKNAAKSSGRPSR